VLKQRPTEPVERVRASMLEVVNRTSLNATDYFTNFLKVKKIAEYLFRWLVNRVLKIKIERTNTYCYIVFKNKI
jgi:hypothetical protein